MSTTEDNALAQADGRLADWNNNGWRWYNLYYGIGTATVILTITVAARPNFLQQSVDVSTIAWLAAIFQGIGTFLAALPKASAYRAAWRTLWIARLEYVESEKTPHDASLLKQAINRGWELIDGGYEGAPIPAPGRPPPAPRRK